MVIINTYFPQLEVTIFKTTAYEVEIAELILDMIKIRIIRTIISKKL